MVFDLEKMKLFNEELCEVQKCNKNKKEPLKAVYDKYDYKIFFIDFLYFNLHTGILTR